MRPVRSSDPRTDGWRRATDRVRSDRRHGARDLGLVTLRALRTELRGWRALSAAERRRTARDVARTLDATQPAMGLFSRWAADWRRLARGRDLRGYLAWVRREERQLETEPMRILARVRSRFPRHATVVTFSRSGTVTALLLGLPRSRSPRRVLALESRPGGEGRGLAAELRRNGMRATCIPDRRAAEAVAGADLVLIGADSVEPDGAVVHKVGTARLAALAQAFGRPLVVVAGRSKFSTRRRRRLPAAFDRTAARAVTAYWTDGPTKRSNDALAGRRTGGRRGRG